MQIGNATIGAPSIKARVTRDNDVMAYFFMYEQAFLFWILMTLAVLAVLLACCSIVVAQSNKRRARNEVATSTTAYNFAPETFQ